MQLPEVPPGPRAKAPLALRYEDLTQDGQLKITRLLHALGSTGFAQLWVANPLIATMQQGIMPILTRLVMTTEASPTMLGAPLEAEGGMQLAREENANGEVQALVLNMFADVYGTLGRSYGQQPEGAGKRIVLGRAFGEHTFTRPFAPAGERKVLRFDVPGQITLPETKYKRRMLPDVLAPEPGDEYFDAAFSADPAPWVFGMGHTDHNQHVNSLVYGTLFEDAALRRLSDHGVDTRLQAAAIELVYRKPCFAGQRVVCQLRAFKRGELVGAVGYVAPEGVAAERAHCALRLLFRTAPVVG